MVLQVPQGQTRNVITIPKDAIVNRQTGKIVFVFQNGQVRPAAVEIGQSFNGKFEILSGLRVGQKIVIKGNELLRPGQRVRVKKSGARGNQSKNKGPNAKSKSKSTSKPRSNKSAGSGNNIPPEKRRALIQSLSQEEKQKFFSMSQEEKQEFFKRKIGGSS